MKYSLTTDHDVKSVHVRHNENHSFTAEIDGAAHQVTYERMNDHTLHLSVASGDNTREANVYLADTADGKMISIGGIVNTVRDADAISRNQTGKGSAAALPDTVTPPMPATVISVMVTTDDVVKKGDAVVIVSAMKMETTLAAPFNGRVTSVNTSEGDRVMPGDILLDIEKEK